MGSFAEVINDVTSVLKKAIMINTLMNTVILFLLLYLCFTLINLYPLILSLIISLFYLVYVWAKKVRLYTIGMVENRFPELKDRLMTAKDNLDKENFVVTKLRVEVTKKLRDVEAGDLFNYTKLMFKVIAIIVFIFLIVFVTAMDFMIFDAQAALGKIHLNIGLNDNENDGANGLENASGEGLEFDIPNTIDYNDIQDTETEDFKKEEFLSYDELKAIGAQEYKDPITEEEKEIVRSYFDKINSR